MGTINRSRRARQPLVALVIAGDETKSLSDSAVVDEEARPSSLMGSGVVSRLLLGLARDLGMGWASTSDLYVGVGGEEVQVFWYRRRGLWWRNSFLYDGGGGTCN